MVWPVYRGHNEVHNVTGMATGMPVVVGGRINSHMATANKYWQALVLAVVRPCYGASACRAAQAVVFWLQRRPRTTEHHHRPQVPRW